MNNCYAEDFIFSFKNDIRFGDSRSIVHSKERSVSLVPDNPNLLRIDNTTLSGIENSTVIFTFEYDKLIEIKLDYGDTKLDVALVNYETINDGQKRKYGQPVEDVKNTITYGGGVIEIYKKWGLGEDKITNKMLNEENQWIINIGEEYKIVIEHILFNYLYKQDEDSEPETLVYHSVSYQYLPAGAKPTDYIDKDL